MIYLLKLWWLNILQSYEIFDNDIISYKNGKKCKAKRRRLTMTYLVFFFINSACQPFALVISVYESCGKKNVGHAYVCEL